MYTSHLSTQSMLIDITVFVGSFCVVNSLRSFSDSRINLYQTERENNMIKWTLDSDTTHLSHDHDLIARKIKLFDSLSENDFRLSIGIDLTIALKSK